VLQCVAVCCSVVEELIRGGDGEGEGPVVEPNPYG